MTTTVVQEQPANHRTGRTGLVVRSLPPGVRPAERFATHNQLDADAAFWGSERSLLLLLRDLGLHAGPVVLFNGERAYRDLGPCGGLLGPPAVPAVPAVPTPRKGNGVFENWPADAWRLALADCRVELS